MINSRDASSRTYNEVIAEEIFIKIKEKYITAFKALKTKMKIMSNK